MPKHDGIGQFTSTMYVLFEDGHPLALNRSVTYWFMHQADALTFLDDWEAIRSRPVSAVPIVGYAEQIRLAEELNRVGVSRIALNAIVPGPFVTVEARDHIFYLRRKLEGPTEAMN